MLKSHCNNNDQKKINNKMKNAKNMRKKWMRSPGRKPTICGLIDNRANHYATESAASMENS